MKVGNHGNPDATSAEFADAVAPKYAVISTNTKVDTDSANESVISKLKNADVYVTEEYDVGVIFKSSVKGKIDIENVNRPNSAEALMIESVDKESQCVTIRNNGQRLDISNFIIYSDKGNEIYTFPNNTFIEKNQVISITALGGSGDYIWNDDKIWNVDKEDKCILYNQYGILLSTYN